MGRNGLRGPDQPFNQDADVAELRQLRRQLRIPIGWEGMKLELMANHQSTRLHERQRRRTFRSQPPPRQLRHHLLPRRNPGAVQSVVRGDAVLHRQRRRGHARSRRSDVTTATRFSASAGVGVKVPIQSHAGIRGEIRGFYTSLPNDTRAGCATTRTTAISSRARRTSGCISSSEKTVCAERETSPLRTSSIRIAGIEEHFPCAVRLFFPDGHVRSFARLAR